MKCDFCDKEIKKPEYIDHKGTVFCKSCYKDVYDDDPLAKSKPEKIREWSEN